MAKARRSRSKPRRSRTLNFLGLALVEPTPQLRARAKIPARYAGPFVARVSDTSRLSKRDRPPVGASFWLVTFSMFTFSWRVPVLRQRHRTRSLTEFAEVILARSLSPEQQRRYMLNAVDDLRRKTPKRFTGETARVRREIAQDLEKWAGKVRGHLCGMVWISPDGDYTYTTSYTLRAKDQEALRAWLEG